MDQDLSLREYLDSVASDAPTPGGGSVAALTAALASALGSMVTSITARTSQDPDLQALAEVCTQSRNRFAQLAEADEHAFGRVMDALRLPKDNPARADRLEASLEEAATVPLDTVATCQRLLAALQQLAGLASRHCVSDVGAAALLGLAAARACLLNVHINASFMRRAGASQAWSRAADTAEQQVQQLCDHILSDVIARVRS